MLAVDVTEWLTSNGHTAVWTDDMPDEPDDLIVVYEYPGQESTWLRDSGDTPAIEQPRVQVAIRGTAYMALANRAEAVHATMLTAHDVTINGRRYGHIRHLQDGWMKSRDERNRRIWSMNYQVYRGALIV